MQKFALAFILTVLLSACASQTVPWQNPNLPSDQWSKDWRACKRWAEQQVGYNDDDSHGPFKDFDRAAAKRQLDAYAGSCMRERGYYPKGR